MRDRGQIRASCATLGGACRMQKRDAPRQGGRQTVQMQGDDRGEKEKKIFSFPCTLTHSPLFSIKWMLAAGKMVAFPASSVTLTVRAPFSSIMYVSVVPLTATTKFAARGW